MNQFGICEKCLGYKMDEVVKRLKEIDSNFKITEGCQNLCGIGRTKLFVIVNHIPVISDNIDDLIDKVKERLN